MHWVWILFLTALLAMAPGYGSAQSAGGKSASPATQPKGTEEKETPAQAAKIYTPKERQAYQQKVAADLDKLQQKIGDLGAEGQTVAPQMKRARLKIMVGLQRQVFAARNQLTDLEKAPENKWSGLKAEMDKAMRDLTKAYKEVEAHLE